LNWQIKIGQAGGRTVGSKHFDGYLVPIKLVNSFISWKIKSTRGLLRKLRSIVLAHPIFNITEIISSFKLQHKECSWLLRK
jgi:hypothetical protein